MRISPITSRENLTVLRQIRLQWKHASSPFLKKAMIVLPSYGNSLPHFLLIQKHCVQKGHTINGENYASLLKQLRRDNKTKSPGQISEGVYFHQENATAPRSFVSMTALWLGFWTVSSPFQSSWTDYHLFPNIKNIWQNLSQLWRCCIGCWMDFWTKRKDCILCQFY